MLKQKTLSLSQCKIICSALSPQVKGDSWQDCKLGWKPPRQITGKVPVTKQSRLQVKQQMVTLTQQLCFLKQWWIVRMDCSIQVLMWTRPDFFFFLKYTFQNLHCQGREVYAWIYITKGQGRLILLLDAKAAGNFKMKPITT